MPSLPLQLPHRPEGCGPPVSNEASRLTVLRSDQPWLFAIGPRAAISWRNQTAHARNRFAASLFLYVEVLRLRGSAAFQKAEEEARRRGRTEAAIHLTGRVLKLNQMPRRFSA